MNDTALNSTMAEGRLKDCVPEARPSKLQEFLYQSLIIHAVIAGILLLKFLIVKLVQWRKNRKLEKWAELSQKTGKLYVHCVPPAKTMPSPSPYVMKIVTYLRMAGIPHEVDTTEPFGGKGKTPWISSNGENVADTQFIMEFFKKMYGDVLNSRYTPEQIGTAKAIRVMLEEHANWGMLLERFVYGFRHNRDKVFEMNRLKAFLVKKVMRKRAIAQGLGVHSEEDMVKLVSADFKAVSDVLGTKKFILGEQPCAEDAGIFGQLSQFYWGLPGNPYEELLNGECRNLREYCNRIKEQFWADWN